MHIFKQAYLSNFSRRQYCKWAPTWPVTVIHRLTQDHGLKYASIICLFNMRSGRISLTSEYHLVLPHFQWLINRRICHDMPTYFQSTELLSHLLDPIASNRPKWRVASRRFLKKVRVFSSYYYHNWHIINRIWQRLAKSEFLKITSLLIHGSREAIDGAHCQWYLSIQVDLNSKTPVVVALSTCEHYFSSLNDRLHFA